MFCKRLWLLASCLLTLGTILAAGEPANSVRINGFQAHATRILLKPKANATAQSATVRTAALNRIAASGMEVKRVYSLVPGLMVLDEPKSAAVLSAIASPEAKAQRLMERIQFLMDSGEFEYASPDYVRYAFKEPTDQRFVDGTLWGLKNTGQNGGVAGVDVNAVNAWDRTTGTNSVIVAVIDTGIRYTHRDLAANVWVNTGEIPGNGIDDDNNGYVDDVHGINSITGSGDPFDDNDHGTHVSGTIGAAANNGEPHVGVAWNVSLMGCKFLDADGSGFDSDAIACIQYAIQMKARISNNSWGGGGADPALLAALMAARDNGLLFVAAAGNGGDDGVGDDNDVVPDYPAGYAVDNIIAVAAIDRKGRLASFSNFGKKTVHIGAPGVEIFSSIATSDTAYDVFQGTSMATPHVVGVAALVMSAFPSIGLAELKERILFSAVPLDSLKGKTVTGGRVDAFNAIDGEVTGTLSLSVSPVDGSKLVVNEAGVIRVKVTDLFPVRGATVTATINGPGVNNQVLPFPDDGMDPDKVADDGTYSANFTPPALGAYQFQFIASATNEIGVTNIVNYSALVRPPYDNFSTPRKVATVGGSITDDDTTLASFQTGEPIHAGDTNGVGSLWYAWTPDKTGSVLVDSTGTGTPVLICVYTGTSLQNIKQVAAAVPMVPKTSVALTFDATAGVTYRIAVVGYGQFGRGPFRFRITPGGIADVLPPVVAFTSPADGAIATSTPFTVTGTAVDPLPSPSGVKQVLVNGETATLTGNSWSKSVKLQPGVNLVSVKAQDQAENISGEFILHINYRLPVTANDAFASATVLAPESAVVTGNNASATRELGEPLHGGSIGGHSVWWRYTATADGVLSLSTTNSTLDTLLGVYSGDQVGNLTTLASNDDATPGSGYSATSVALRSGQTVSIAVDGFAGAVGDISLSYDFQATKLFTLTINTGAGGKVDVASGLIASNAPVTLTATPDTYYGFAGWTGTLATSDNPLSFVMKGDVTLTANFILIPFTDDFETGGLTHLHWVTSGAAPWGVQSNTAARGTFAAQAGTIGDSAFSSLSLQGTSLGGEGSFDYKVSSEDGWDYLEFYVNNALVQRWSGEIPWTTFTFPLPSGSNQFEWRYVKDAGRSSGQDTAWLDNVQLRLRPAIDGTSKAQVKFVGFVDGTAKIQVQGQLNQSYVVQASGNLTNWTEVSTIVNTDGTFTVVDPGSTGTTNRFYRAIVAP